MNSKIFKRNIIITLFVEWSTEWTVCMLHITPDDSHIIRKMEIGLATMPSVLSAAPSETAACSTLFIIREIMVDEPLFSTCRHEYVH